MDVLSGSGLPLPRYFQVKSAIETDIRDGRFQPGDLLPSERLLCQRYGVSSITIRRALRELSQDGLISRANGVGTFVAARTRKLRVALVIHGFEEDRWRIRSQMFGGLIGSIGQVLWEERSAFSLIHAPTDPELREILAGVLDERSFDGLLLRSAGAPPTEAVELLHARRFAYVAIKRVVSGPAGTYVTVDNPRSAALATAHLLDRGHERVACVVGPVTSTTFADRAEGYLAELRRRGLRVVDGYLRFGATAFEDAGYQEASALLALPQPPTAIFVGDDLMVQGVYQAIKERGLRIPADVALVGFDEIGFAERYDPPLTALGPTDFELGLESARLLLRLLRGDQPPRTGIVLEPTLTIRASSTPETESAARPAR
jgi:DNA-binding LacI/PurR family transcriptional regulator